MGPRSKRLRLAALLLYVWESGACRPAPIQVEVPSTSTAKSLIVGLDDGTALQVVAVRLDRPMNLPRVRAYGGRATITALLYDRDLDALGVPEGALTQINLETANAGFARRLPKPDRREDTTVLGTSPAQWVTATTAGDLGRLDMFRYKGDKNLCVDWTPTFLDIGQMNEDILEIAPIDQNTDLAFGTVQNHWFLITHQGVTKTATIPGFRALSSFADGRGTIWLGGHQGQLYAGRLGSFTLRTQSPRKGRIRWIDGPHDGSPFELFTVSLEGDFERFDGTSWELIASTPPPKPLDQGGVAWIGPGEALGFTPQPISIDTYVFYYRATESPKVSAFLFAPARFGEVNRVTTVPGIGAVGVTRLGEVFRFTMDNYHYLGSAMEIDDPRSIAPYRDGILTAARGMEIAQYSQIVDLCPTRSIRSDLFPDSIGFLGNSVVLAGHTDSGAGTLILLDPVE